MADRDAEFTLSATDRTKGATESAADGFERVGRSADKAQRKLDDVGDEAGQVARKMLEAKAAALALAREFDKTGDSKVLKDFQKINREAAGLAKIAKSLKFDPPEIKNPDGFLGAVTRLAKKAGLVASDAAVDGFGSLLKSLPPQVQAALVVGASAGIAWIAAALEGAVLAGVAAGAIGLGVILAAQSNKVQAQYGSLADKIMLDLRDAGKPMEEQLLGTVPKLSAAFDRELPGIRRILAGAAADFQPLIDGAIGFLHEALPGIERAAQVGGKILGTVAGQLPQLGAAVTHLLNAFSDGGRGGAAGLTAMVIATRELIEVFATLAVASAPALNTIGRVMELMGLVPQAGGRLTQLATAQERAALSASQSASSYDALSHSLGNTANMAKQLQDNFDALFNKEMGVDQANLAVNIGMSQLTETIKNNKKTLDQSTESGQQNTQGILAQIEALNRKREADIKAGNGTAEATAQANAAYAAQVQSLRNLLVAMGLPIGAVDALIAKYAQIPREITTNVRTVFTTVYRTDGTPATGHSQNPRGDLGGLDTWAPARFSTGRHAEFVETSGQGRYQPPVQVNTENTVNVLLDGTPFRAQVRTATRASEQRQAWRNKVGTR